MFDDLTNVLEECIDFSLMLGSLVGWRAAVFEYILAGSARSEHSFSVYVNYPHFHQYLILLLQLTELISLTMP